MKMKLVFVLTALSLAFVSLPESLLAYCHDACGTSGTYHGECNMWGSEGCYQCCSRNNDFSWSFCQLCDPNGPEDGVCRTEAEATACFNSAGDWYNGCMYQCERLPQQAMRNVIRGGSSPTLACKGR